MKALWYLSVLAALAVLAGCTANNTASTYTISGTVTATSWGISSPATITVTQGSNTYSASATVPAPDGNGLQTIAYSVSGVPAGTYSVTASATDGQSGGPSET